jgi:hypothetical protein
MALAGIDATEAYTEAAANSTAAAGSATADLQQKQQLETAGADGCVHLQKMAIWH